MSDKEKKKKDKKPEKKPRISFKFLRGSNQKKSARKKKSEEVMAIIEDIPPVQVKVYTRIYKDDSVFKRLEQEEYYSDSEDELIFVGSDVKNIIRHCFKNALYSEMSIGFHNYYDGFQFVDLIVDFLNECGDDDDIDSLVSSTILFLYNWTNNAVYFEYHPDVAEYVISELLSLDMLMEHPKCDPIESILKEFIKEETVNAENFEIAPVLSVIEIMANNFVVITDQLCLCAQLLMRKIEPRECMKQAWFTNKSQAQNLIKFTKFVQNLTNWVKSTVLNIEEVEDRASMLIQYIKISLKSREYHNYCISKCIVSGLSDPTIDNLSSTWLFVKQMEPKLCKLFDDLKALFSRDNNFLAYRMQIADIDPPAIPFLDSFFKDLVIVDETNPDFLNENGKEYINFEKMKLLSEIISKNLIIYQNEQYEIEKKLSLFNYFSDHLEDDIIPSQKCWELSEALVAKELDNPNTQLSNWEIMINISRINGIDERIQRQKLLKGIQHKLEDEIVLVSSNFTIRVKGGTPTSILQKIIETTQSNADIVAFVKYMIDRYISPRRTLSVLSDLYIRLSSTVEPTTEDKKNHALICNNIVGLLATWGKEKPQEFEILDALIGDFFKKTFKNEEIGNKKLYDKFQKELNTVLLVPVMFSLNDVQDYFEFYTIGSFQTFNFKTVAEQISLFEQNLLLSIPKYDWVDNIMSKKWDSPLITYYLKFFNRSKKWIIDTILEPNAADQRSKRLQNFLRLLTELFIIKNFNFSKIIIDALTSENIKSLKLSWDIIERKGEFLLGSFRDIQETLSSENNFKNYIKTVKGYSAPYVPYIGIAIREIQFQIKAFPDTLAVNDRDDIYNFSKYAIIVESVSDLYNGSSVLYDFKIVEKMYYFFAWDGPQLENRSKKKKFSSRKTKLFASQDSKVSEEDFVNSSEIPVKKETIPLTPDMETIEFVPPKIIKRCQKEGISLESIEENISLFWNCLKFLSPPSLEKMYDIPGRKTDKVVKDIVPDSWVQFSKIEIEENELTINPKLAKKFFKTQYISGEGGYGCVYCAKNVKNKTLIALKKVAHDTEKQRYYNFIEVAILLKFQHQNIVSFYSAAIVGEELWIEMEFMEGGTLEQATKVAKFTDKHMAYFTQNICKGIKAFHDSNLAHRDLKSPNIMLEVKGNVKLIDFGLCASFENGATRKKMVGSPFWIPPEMIKKKPHGLPADIWSLGVLALEMFLGEPPYYKESGLKCMFMTATKGLTDLIPEDVSDQARSFTTLCLQTNPEDRPTINELLQHEWVNQTDMKRGIEKQLASIFLRDSLEEMGIF